MKFCPPICFSGMKLVLPEPATMLGSNEVALALVGVVLAAVLCVALYRKLRKSEV